MSPITAAPRSTSSDADLRGQGIGPEVITTLLRHLIEDRWHHRVFLGTNVHNARAIRCYEKAGFRTVGTMRLSGRDYRTGKYEDELLMEYVVEPAPDRPYPRGRIPKHMMRSQSILSSLPPR